MTVCEECGGEGGIHGSGCSKKFEDVRRIHDSHSMSALGNFCTMCGQSNALALREVCPRAIDVTIQKVHPSHDLDSIRATGECSVCSHTYHSTLMKECPGKVTTDFSKPPPGFQIQEVSGTFVKDDILWMVYNRHDGPQVVSIHATPEEAIDKNEYNDHIGQWKIGTPFREAVQLWESRNNDKK